MSDFKAKMHKIWFPLGLCARSHWGSLQHSPTHLAVFKGAYSKGMEGVKRREGKRRGQEGEDEGDRKERGGGKIAMERKGFAGPMSGCLLCACDTQIYPCFHRNEMASSADQLECCVCGVGQCPPTD